jgi:hypothetical protein
MIHRELQDANKMGSLTSNYTLLNILMLHNQIIV